MAVQIHVNGNQQQKRTLKILSLFGRMSFENAGSLVLKEDFVEHLDGSFAVTRNLG